MVRRTRRSTVSASEAAHAAGRSAMCRAAEAAPGHPSAERPGRHRRLDDEVELGARHLVVVPQRRVRREEEPADLVASRPSSSAATRRPDPTRSRSPRGGRGRAAGGRSDAPGRLLGRLPQRRAAPEQSRPPATQSSRRAAYPPSTSAWLTRGVDHEQAEAGLLEGQRDLAPGPVGEVQQQRARRAPRTTRWTGPDHRSAPRPPRSRRACTRGPALSGVPASAPRRAPPSPPRRPRTPARPSWTARRRPAPGCRRRRPVPAREPACASAHSTPPA